MLVHWVVTYPPPLPPMRRHVSFLLLESQVMRRRSSTGVSLAISSEMTQPPSWTVDSIPNQHICPLLLEPPYEAVHFNLPSANGIAATLTGQVFERSVLYWYIGSQGNYSYHPLTDGLESPVTRGASWPGVQAPSTHHGRGILCFDWANYVGGERH